MKIEHRAVAAAASELRISDSLARNVVTSYLNHYAEIHYNYTEATEATEPTRRRWWQRKAKK